jgi:tetratricopeptide (TPR) repeat protein
VWRGEYSQADKDAIKITYWAVDAISGKVMNRQELTGTIIQISSLVSQMSLAMLPGSGITATKEEIDRISMPKTSSFKAFEQNSLGFEKQILLYGKKGHMISERGSWIEHCKKAVAVDPDYAEAYINLGWALYSDKSSDEAFKAFSTAVRLKPYLLDGWMGLGYIHRDRGNRGLAMDAFQKATSINGNLEWPKDELKKVITAAAPAAKQMEAKPLTADTSIPQTFESTLSPEEKQLLLLVDHESLDIRIDAVRSLARAKGKLSIPFLKRMINRKDQAFDVLKLLTNVDITESAPYLIEAMEKRITPDESRLSGLTEQNILGVMQLIRRRSLRQAVPVLTRTLADSSATIRESAVLTLGDFGEQESVEPLRKLVAKEQNQMVRMSALVALVELGDAGARETLKTIFSEGKDMDAINYATKLMKQRNIKIDDKQ